MTGRTRSTVTILAVAGFVVTAAVTLLVTSTGGLAGWQESVSLGLTVAGLAVVLGGFGPHVPASTEFPPRGLANIDPQAQKSALRAIRDGRAVPGDVTRLVAERTGRASARTFPTVIGLGLVSLGELLNNDRGTVSSVISAVIVLSSVIGYVWLKRDTDRCSEFLNRTSSTDS